MIGDIIRIALSLVLVVFVYSETGWATALCILLLVARSEVQDFNAGRTWRHHDIGESADGA